MDHDQKFHSKALKYKIKYTQLKKMLQTGGDDHRIMDIIELYDKTYNLYLLYRFRYDNTMPLHDLTKLSNDVFTRKTSLKVKYQTYYIPNITDTKPDALSTLISEKDGNGRVLFTLRQDTTKLIKELLLLNNESVAKVKVYLDFLTSILSDQSIPEPEVYEEIHNKTTQINGLVASGKTDFKISSFDDICRLDKLNKIRYNTNLILNLLGNDFDNIQKRITTKEPIQLDPRINAQLDVLFSTCFEDVKSLLSAKTIEL